MMRQPHEYLRCFYSQFHARRTHLNIIGKTVGHQVSYRQFSARGAEPRVKTGSSNNHQQKVA